MIYTKLWSVKHQNTLWTHRLNDSNIFHCASENSPVDNWMTELPSLCKVLTAQSFKPIFERKSILSGLQWKEEIRHLGEISLFDWIILQVEWSVIPLCISIRDKIDGKPIRYHVYRSSSLQFLVVDRVWHKLQHNFLSA